MRAVLCGYYGMGNGGDEALLASLLQMLPAHVEPIVLSGSPAETKQQYGVEAVPRKSFPAVIQALQRSDAFIWGGGSLMQDSTSLLNPFYYGGLMLLAQRMGLRTIAWGQGVGPLKRSISRWLAQQTFRHCTAVSVRDSASASLVDSWRVPLTLAPDPVWALEGRSVPGLWDLPAPRVAVALRSHPELTPDRLNLIARALADFQKATQTCILLIPFQPVQDLAIAEAIQPQLPGVSRILALSDPQQLKALFHGVEMTIAMRLHALIMAAAAECRCYAISYDPKVSQLMRDFEMPGATLNALPTSAATLTHIWLELFANGDALNPGQIQATVDRALVHQEVLHSALAPIERL
ncbi:polysaccharide pyruvyl transferase CsaB [Leptolyngbya ohadii]|uniref:polysaccharide pyruvyl transferase CsaB n=1 Tax=Leptolyngbya ohadii TaxID=1962290 RepID=UPI000B598684|nr:polysaccharide pyruvyl transferase CsaB [Leptolyngbya ohadii]